MRAVVQRVTRASVTIEGDIVGEIGNGLVVLLSIARDDTKAHGLLKRRVRTGRNLLNETIELEPNYMPTHFLLALVRIQEKCLAEDLFRRVGFLN